MLDGGVSRKESGSASSRPLVVKHSHTIGYLSTAVSGQSPSACTVMGQVAETSGLSLLLTSMARVQRPSICRSLCNQRRLNPKARQTNSMRGPQSAIVSAMRASIVAEGACGQPPVVYVPGIDGTGELLLGTAQRIERSFHLVRLRYEGRQCREIADGTARPKDLYEELAASIALSLDEINLPRAVLLAESFGGGVALRFALDFPERVAGIVLVNTFCWYPERFRAALGAALFPWTPTFFLRLGRRVMPGALFFRPRRDAEVEREFAALQPGFTDPGFGDRLRALRGLDLRSSLGSVRCPVALFASTHDRVVPTMRTMPLLANGLPNATFERIERAGHIVLPLREEPWEERLIALQRRVEQG